MSNLLRKLKMKFIISDSEASKIFQEKTNFSKNVLIMLDIAIRVGLVAPSVGSNTGRNLRAAQIYHANHVGRCIFSDKTLCTWAT